MTPKLYQKKSNRFLQLALPENLIANKRIGKREKYHHRPGAAANNLRGMEKRVLGQWAFSWNMYKKRMSITRQIALSRRFTGRPEKMGGTPPTLCYPTGLSSISSHPPLFPRARFMDCFTPPPFLVSPSLYILEDRISRALGGNVIQYLKSSGEQAEPNHPVMNLNLPPRFAGESTLDPLDHPAPLGCFFWDRGEKAQETAPTCFSSQRPSAKTFSPDNLRSNCAVHFGKRRGEMLTEHCRKNNWNMIYSLLAAQILQNKARGDRRDRIADHYRNQLAEWRKIAFLYGGLPLKAALRLQRRAHLLGGDVDSNFLSLLESRLDVMLKRAFFFSTLKAARQWIQRGKIYVNNQRCTLAGTLLQPADIITISPAAAAEWKKERSRTLAALGIRAGIWNRNNTWRGGRDSADQPRLSPRYRVTEFTSAKRWGRQMVFPPRGNRRFPFSPSLMRKWKEWSQIWGNSCVASYSFSQKHNWPHSFHNPISGAKRWGNDKFTGKNGQRGVSSTQSLYSSSCLANYLSARKLFFDKGQYLESEKKWRDAHVTRQSTTDPVHSLLQRRETSVTNLIFGFSSPTFHDGRGRKFPPVRGDSRLRQIGGAKPQWQGAGRDKFGRVTAFSEMKKSTPSLFIRLGQVIGGERKERCQWLHQRQSNVVDGLHALRWNRGFARKKMEGEKKDQLSVSTIKPLHLECSYRLGTVIFLFFPQKLAWPGSINVSLLRKRLGG